MKFTNKDALNSYALMTGLNEHGKLGFVIAKNMRKFESELQEYFRVRDEALQKYGTLNENGMYSIAEDNFTAYCEEMNEYDGIVCDIPVTQVDEETFCSGGLGSKEMYILDWMVQE